MFNCWYEDPLQRPRFSGLVQGLSDMLEEEAGYFNLSRSLSWKKQGESLAKVVSAVSPPRLCTIEEGEKEDGREGSTEENVELENLACDDLDSKEHTTQEEIASL